MGRTARYKAEQEPAYRSTFMDRDRHQLRVVGASIELAVEFERTGEGGISFKVMGVGADVKGALKSANTTIMTVQLAPQQGDIWIAEER
jgi:hypothetical protein